MRTPICFKLETALPVFPAAMAFCVTGTAKAAKSPMIDTTTNSSTRVKAGARLRKIRSLIFFRHEAEKDLITILNTTRPSGKMALMFVPKNRIFPPSPSCQRTRQSPPMDQGNGLASILTLSIPGVPVPAQKPILTLVPAGILSALTVWIPALEKSPLAKGTSVTAS